MFRATSNRMRTDLISLDTEWSSKEKPWFYQSYDTNSIQVKFILPFTKSPFTEDMVNGLAWVFFKDSREPDLSQKHSIF
jgi:hypothetical protein